jgi:hypothetical protein
MKMSGSSDDVDAKQLDDWMRLNAGSFSVLDDGIVDDQPWCYLATWFDLNKARRGGMMCSFFLVLKSCLCHNDCV